MNNFARQLAESNNPVITNALDRFYRQTLGATAIERVQDLPRQKQGIDVIIETKWGTIRIDEKIRTTDYGDMLIEKYSCLRTKSIGWTIDPTKLTELIVYVVPGFLYLIPAKPLRKLILSDTAKFFYYGREWRADNGAYESVFYSCPWEDLASSIPIKKFSFSCKN